MKIIDLFCGAGGMSLGFAQAGYSVVGAVDNWEPAVECYRKNLKCNPFYRMDLSDWKSVVEKFQGVRADVIVGGPPCQDFSEAGEKVEGDRANLTRCFARIIHKLRPTYFVMENVPPAVESHAYKTARGIFKRSGYGLTEVVLDASLCGVPQSRKRFFCIGSLRDKNRFLLKTLFARQSDIPMSLRDYIGDEFGFNYYYRHPRTYGRRGVYTLDEPAPTIRGVNRPLPKKYKKHPSDLVDPHKYKVRALSFKERARVQMFPSNYVWTEQASCNDQMIGNAVPVGLARFVADSLLRYAKKGDDNLPLLFTEWQQTRKRIRKEAAGDNLSRYRRACRLLMGVKCNKSNMVSKLKGLKSFAALSSNVQSQLKRACELHSEYLDYLAEREG